MEPYFWTLEKDPRIDPLKHFKRVEVNGRSRFALTDEGAEIAREVLADCLKDWDNDVGFIATRSQGKYVISIAPDKVRHAMERTELRPTMFVAMHRALCQTEYKEHEWTILAHTLRDTVYQTGVVNCDYCVGILTFTED